MRTHVLLPAALVVAASLSACSDERSAGMGPNDGANGLTATTTAVAPDSDDGDDWARTYEITLENLTPVTGQGSSQVFSAPFIAVHNHEVHVFQEGRRASDALAQLAEDGLTQPLLDALGGSALVHSAVAGTGTVAPGASATWQVTAIAGFDRLSMAFMLTNTNDTFSGVDAVRFPKWREESIVVTAYDAGSEANTELTSDIPGPCCGNAAARVLTHDSIGPSRGILGVGDLDPDLYGWEGPVARITIRRLNPRYEVTVRNLMPAGSQVLSPPLLATHGTATRLLDVGGLASPELTALAEDGLTGPLVGLLSATDNVLQIVEAPAAISPGGSATLEIEVDRGRRYLSLAAMLVNTNDGFTALDAMELTHGGSVTVQLGAWDAGSEENTELHADIPGPCCGSVGARVPSEERIHHHAGIQGVGDLDRAVYGWQGPPASVTITRIR